MVVVQASLCQWFRRVHRLMGRAHRDGDVEQGDEMPVCQLKRSHVGSTARLCWLWRFVARGLSASQCTQTSDCSLYPNTEFSPIYKYVWETNGPHF